MGQEGLVGWSWLGMHLSKLEGQRPPHPCCHPCSPAGLCLVPRGPCFARLRGPGSMASWEELPLAQCHRRRPKDQPDRGREAHPRGADRSGFPSSLPVAEPAPCQGHSVSPGSSQDLGSLEGCAEAHRRALARSEAVRPSPHPLGWELSESLEKAPGARKRSGSLDRCSLGLVCPRPGPRVALAQIELGAGCSPGFGSQLCWATLSPSVLTRKLGAWPQASWGGQREVSGTAQGLGCKPALVGLTLVEGRDMGSGGPGSRAH